jgi:hypothetical protein
MLTKATRRDLREELARIRKDLERKEGQAKALASPSPSGSLSASPSATP